MAERIDILPREQWVKWSDVTGFLYTPDGVQSWFAKLRDSINHHAEHYIDIMQRMFVSEFDNHPDAERVGLALSQVVVKSILDMPLNVTMWDTDIYIAAAVGCEAFNSERVDLQRHLKSPGTKPGLNLWTINTIRPVPSGAVLDGIEITSTTNKPIIRLADLYICWHPDYPTTEYASSKRAFIACQIFKSEDRLGRPIIRAISVQMSDDLTIGNHTGLCNIIARTQFLNQPFIAVNNARLPKAAERDYERRKRALPSVNVVSLRRVEHRHNEESEGKDVAWSCQWLVGGHWRNQYIPHTKEGEPDHRTVYVRPYVKGPKDKPLRAKVPTVYVAKR
jgi:hypothetical protein